MSDKDIVDEVKQKHGILSKIQDVFTLGYGTKEDLRELDKKLRDIYYADLRDMRHTWEDMYLTVLDSGASSTRDFKKVIQVLDRVMEKVRHADYGYAGLLDRKGQIRENQLAHIFNYDKNLKNDIESIKVKIENVNQQAEAEKFETINQEIKEIKNILLDFEELWQERENHFRPLNI